MHYILKMNNKNYVDIPVVGKLHNALTAANNLIREMNVKEVEVFCSKKEKVIAVLKLEAQNSYERC